MAKNTKTNLRNLLIYQVYTRNHNKSGTFKELENDLPRIKALGTDILYLLPIHPIGQKQKKGSLGCPYSIQNYRKINPEYGTLEDFESLIKKTHQQNMKIMIDVVYNHTSRDSELLKTHPQWFYKNNKGEFANRVGDWSDVTDLDYENKDLWAELIDTLCYWAKLGVDGFRCDVAPLVPHDFWIEAREAVSKINPNQIWLAETIHPGFVQYIRDSGFDAMTDSQTYDAFDICYDYDIFEYFSNYLDGKSDLKQYIQAIENQESCYPKNYVKLRNLENHDQPRIASKLLTENQLKMWTTFQFMQKGAAMVYAGQEAVNTNKPSLFKIDKVDWNTLNKWSISDYITDLAKLKKNPIMAEGLFKIATTEIADTAYIYFYNPKNHAIRFCLFNFGFRKAKINVKEIFHFPNKEPSGLKDGKYTDLLTKKTICVEDGSLSLTDEPIVIDLTE